MLEIKARLHFFILVNGFFIDLANLVLVGARKGGKGALQVLPPLVVYESKGQYTKEMLDIYGR